MARPPALPAEEKTRIVLAILAGELTVAEAARRAKRARRAWWSVLGPVLRSIGGGEFQLELGL